MLWTVKSDVIGGARMYWRHDVRRNKRISDPMTEREMVEFCTNSDDPSAKRFLEFRNLFDPDNSYTPKKD